MHISMVGFDASAEVTRRLDGRTATAINANLTSVANVGDANPLRLNSGVAFMGVTKQGPFDVTLEGVSEWLSAPNASGLPNSDVLVPYLNGKDVTQRSRQAWLITFPLGSTLEAAARYEAPLAFAQAHVKPFRAARQRGWFRDQWWQLYAGRPELRQAMDGKQRYVATPRVAKHRLFVWLEWPILPDCQLIVFARDDDYSLGVLHSRSHELWARASGTQLREAESGFRYTPTTCFETFPFPEPTDAQREAIGAAAKELDGLRARWLNPPEWTKQEVLEFPGSAGGPWARYVHDADADAIGTVRYPRVVARDGEYAKLLVKRTLTNLYNERPAWLDLAHRRLDEAVAAAFGWPVDLSDEELLARLLELNVSRNVNT